jgi:hypothetical protein
MKGANTETKVVYKNVTKIDVVCKKSVEKKIRNDLKNCRNHSKTPETLLLKKISMNHLHGMFI